MATIHPLVDLMTGYENVVFADSGDAIVLYGLRYDINGFNAVIDNKFRLGLTFKNSSVALQMFPGTGFASSTYGGNLCTASSVIFENIYDTSVAQSVIETDGIVYALQGYSNPIVKLKPDLKTVVASSGADYGTNYYGAMVGLVKLPDGNYLLSATYSYYDKGVLFMKYDSNLNKIHGSKISNNYGTVRIIGNMGGFSLAATCGMNDYARYILYRYDSGSQGVTTLVDFKGANNKMTSIPTQFVDEPPAYTGKKVALILQPKNANSLYYRAIILDKNSVTATKEDWTVDYGKHQESDFIALGNERRQGVVGWITKHSTSNGDIWYAHFLFVSRNDYNLAASYYKLMTFQIDWTNKKLVFKSSYNFNQRIHSFLPTRSDYTSIIVLGVSSTFTATFNPTTAEWDVFTLDVVPKYVFYDSMGRLWLIDSANRLYSLIRTAPAQVVVRLKNPDIEIIDQPVDNNLLIDAYNYKGERVAATVIITFKSDNIEFADGTKSKTIQTSDTDTTSVPVKITDGGAIEADVVVKAL